MYHNNHFDIQKFIITRYYIFFIIANKWFECLTEIYTLTIQSNATFYRDIIESAFIDEIGLPVIHFISITWKMCLLSYWHTHYCFRTVYCIGLSIVPRNLFSSFPYTTSKALFRNFTKEIHSRASLYQGPNVLYGKTKQVSRLLTQGFNFRYWFSALCHCW